MGAKPRTLPDATQIGFTLKLRLPDQLGVTISDSLTSRGESIIKPSLVDDDRMDHPREWRNLADAPDLGSGGETHGGSSPPSRTSAVSVPQGVAGDCKVRLN